MVIVNGADVSADAPEREALLVGIAEEAGCGEDCRLMAGYSVAKLADVVWHGVPQMRAETYVEGLADNRTEIVDWVKRMHDAVAALHA